LAEQRVLKMMIDRLAQDAVPLLACSFFAVLFLQSGLDKVTDRAGNLAWMEPHFEKSPFRGKVGFFLSALSVLELATGLLAAAGLIELIAEMGWGLARYSLWLASLTLLCLFAGQRLAKDYAGAASLAAYFAVALIGVLAVR
jgi:uncharacterized membrane protein YphA (DoxX/SURF4 family)